MNKTIQKNSSTERSRTMPQLRFPEFEGEWDINKLSILTNSISSGKTKALEIGEYPVYGSTGVIGKTDEYTHLGRYILVARVGANAGKINVTNDKFGVTDNTLIIDLKKEIDLDFLKNFLIQFNLNRLVFGSGQPLITGGLLKSIKLSIPTLPEQQKIANFLTAVDSKLQALKKKKELLAQYKKGVMQQLFSVKADGRPSLRFKDDEGNNFADWEVKTLGEVFTFRQGVQCPIEKQFTSKNISLIRFIRIVDLTKSNEPIRYIDNPGSQHQIFENDLFMVRYGNAGLVGYGFTGVIANNLFRIIPKNIRDVNTLFFKHLLMFEQKKLEMLASSSTMPALSFTSLNNFKIPLPSNEEQTKIANFLSAIDDKITSCELLITNAEQYKKGLLQQMFV